MRKHIGRGYYYSVPVHLLNLYGNQCMGSLSSKEQETSSGALLTGSSHATHLSGILPQYLRAAPFSPWVRTYLIFLIGCERLVPLFNWLNYVSLKMNFTSNFRSFIFRFQRTYYQHGKKYELLLCFFAATAKLVTFPSRKKKRNGKPWHQDNIMWFVRTLWSARLKRHFNFSKTMAVLGDFVGKWCWLSVCEVHQNELELLL